jgi:hypothetical protein
MDNVPVHANVPASKGRSADVSGKGLHQNSSPKKNKLKFLALAAGIALILVLAAGGWMLYRSSMPAHIDANKYQAVFFTNGQVYFGKLERLNGGYFKLNDIFYLQAQATDKTTSENPQETTNQSASDVQLVKLGSEIHGPDDEMIMSQDQILFFENLKKDGKVSDSIAKYKAEKK